MVGGDERGELAMWLRAPSASRSAPSTTFEAIGARSSHRPLRSKASPDDTAFNMVRSVLVIAAAPGVPGSPLGSGVSTPLT